MRHYTFQLVVHEGNDEFWESLKGTGCDDVFQYVKDLIEAGGGFQCDGEYQNCDLKITTYKEDMT